MCPQISETCERPSRPVEARTERHGYPSGPVEVARASPRDRRMRAVIEASVGQALGVSEAEFAASTRGRARVALARQIAMYLSHVVCGLSLTDAGRIFARDRTTVAHACAVIEDQRDNPRFDRMLDLMEAIVRWRLWPHPARAIGATPGETA